MMGQINPAHRISTAQCLTSRLLVNTAGSVQVILRLNL